MKGDLVGMVLCAGLGTRLRPLTMHLPKPAVPVCGQPLVRYALALLAGVGVRRVVVNVHHLADRMAETATDSARALDLDLFISREPVIAGTGGALREARTALAGADAIVLFNGDILFDVDLPAMLAAHRVSGALATMVLMPMPDGTRYAAVEIDGAGAVRRIAGSYGPGGQGLSSWHFTGVHILSPAVLDRLDSQPFEQDVNRHLYPPLMEAGLVRGQLASGYWNDLGTPQRYLAANRDVLAGRISLRRFSGADPFVGHDLFGPQIWMGSRAHVDAGALLHAPVLVGDAARIEAGARVGPLAVVGAGALIAPRARVANAVIWEGTVVGPGEEVVGAVAAGSDRVLAEQG
ncbi:MAG TPA: NDP-sugar synthase [Anaeromyxobacteraceae bacterium]|nr:NDP-sugar synthase [Anaeromyxobacteraceae bacterium]